MQSTVLLIVCAAASMAVSLTITVFYKRIRGRFWKKDKYKLPDKIPLFPELESLPDKNSFIRSSQLLDSDNGRRAILADESVVDALITDEGALQSGFSLQGENILLECVSPNRKEWNEVRSFPVIIGKSEYCDLCLTDERIADDRHGLLFMKDNRYFYLDMNSMYGSMVDDTLVTGVTEVGNGSLIQICQTTIRLVLQSNMEK